MIVPRHAFREYDIRGTADRDLTDGIAKGVGQGFATMLGAGERPVHVAVARDCRLSSDRLAAALVTGLTKAGANVIDIGVGPTPMLYAAAHDLATTGAIMITGSHDPADENGFKMMRGKAGFFGADIVDLRKIVEEERFASPREIGRVEKQDTKSRYLERVTAGIRLERTDLKVVLDAGNGSGGPLGIAAMHSLGLSPDALLCEMDGRFPNHPPDPTVPENLGPLIERVRKAGARVGLAYDGDADRLGAVDANGAIVRGDQLGTIFARGVLAEEGTLLAGATSGRRFFADRHSGFDDAIHASLWLLEILARDPRSLSEMLADVTPAAE